MYFSMTQVKKVGISTRPRSCTFSKYCRICNKSGVLKSCNICGPNPYHVKHHAQQAAQVITILFRAVKHVFKVTICGFQVVTSVVHLANYPSLSTGLTCYMAKVWRKVEWRPYKIILSFKVSFCDKSPEIGPRSCTFLSNHHFKLVYFKHGLSSYVIHELPIFVKAPKLYTFDSRDMCTYGYLQIAWYRMSFYTFKVTLCDTLHML